eukprot:m.65249 g.65249  ORF g.65249 m.65249 type:complete len:64 (+) comp14027_c0_seq10:2130-2321(+)
MDLIQGQEQINDRGYLELDNSVPEVVIDVGSIKITMPRVYKGKDMEVRYLLRVEPYFKAVVPR